MVGSEWVQSAAQNKNAAYRNSILGKCWKNWVDWEYERSLVFVVANSVSL